MTFAHLHSRASSRLTTIWLILLVATVVSRGDGSRHNGRRCTIRSRRRGDDRFPEDGPYGLAFYGYPDRTDVASRIVGGYLVVVLAVLIFAFYLP